VQQFAKIAGRNGNEAGTVSVGCDGHGAEWRSLKRELDAERVAIAERFAYLSGNDRYGGDVEDVGLKTFQAHE